MNTVLQAFREGLYVSFSETKFLELFDAFDNFYTHKHSTPPIPTEVHCCWFHDHVFK